MKAVGVLVMVLGGLVFLGGLGMDTTETATTCYEADYDWDMADSSGCVETTYSNPAPKVGTVMLGLSMAIGGGVLASRSDGTDGYRETVGSSGGSFSTSRETSETFAEKLQEQRDKEESE